MSSEGEEQTKEKLSLVSRIAFGMGNMLNILGVVGMWFPYALSFFTKVLLIPHNQAATIVLVAQVSGGVFTPLVGMLSDMCKCRGPIYGRRKIFHLIGVIAFVLSFFFLWHDCFGCHWQFKYRTLYYSVLAVVFQFGYAATQIPQLAMVPELAPNKHMKIELNSIRFGFQVTGTLVMFIILWILLLKLPESGGSSLGVNSTMTSSCDDVSSLNSGNAKVFWIMAIIVIGLGFLMTIPFHVVVREKNTVLKKMKWYKWLVKPDFYLIICVFIASKIVTIFTQQYLPFFFLDTLKMNQESVSIGPLVLYIGSFIATLAAKRVNKLIGEKMLYFLGTVLVWGALMWFWVQPEHGDHEHINFYWKRDCIYIAILLLGIGGATLMVLSLSMVSILIGDFSGSSAFVCGWVLFADRVSNGVLNKLVLALKSQNNDCTFSMQENLRDAKFYRHVIVYTPFAATVLGLASICLLVLYQYWKRRGMLQAVTASDQARANVQISNTVADKASLHSSKISAAICCSRCHESPTLDQPSAAIDKEERRSLVESYREELLTSSVHVHKPLQDYDFEIFLAT